MTVRVIGIDCATDERKIGLALGEYAAAGLSVLSIKECSAKQSAALQVCDWLTEHPATLLALDAPLGWPEGLGQALGRHVAGQPCGVDPDLMFRRETDRYIKRVTGRTPLDVGADRIARTAHAALRLPDRVRRQTGLPIPLAWSPVDCSSAPAAIEVYPAASLLAHGCRASGYKKPEQVRERQGIVCQLSPRLVALKVPETDVTRSGDALDSVVCLVAGEEFLAGNVFRPEDCELARKEAWIWVGSPSRIDSPARESQVRSVRIPS